MISFYSLCAQFSQQLSIPPINENSKNKMMMMLTKMSLMIFVCAFLLHWRCLPVCWTYLPTHSHHQITSKKKPKRCTKQIAGVFVLFWLYSTLFSPLTFPNQPTNQPTGPPPDPRLPNPYLFLGNDADRKKETYLTRCDRVDSFSVLHRLDSLFSRFLIVFKWSCEKKVRFEVFVFYFCLSSNFLWFLWSTFLLNFIFSIL